MNIEFCSKALYTADAKLNEMLPQVYFILSLVFSPKLFIIAQKHMSTLFYSTYEKGENWVNYWLIIFFLWIETLWGIYTECFVNLWL